MEKLILNPLKEAKILVFLFIILTIIIILLLSKIRIEVKKFSFSSMTKRHINLNYEIIIKLCVFHTIPILKINVTKTKLEKLKLKEKIKKVNVEILENNHKLDSRILKAIKKLNLMIRKIDLHIDIGTENSSFTAILVPILSTILAIILQKKVRNCKNQRFKINPIFINQNLINIAISGIFEIKVIHIISIIYILNKKEGVDKYERTSNRRTYGYSYE